MRLETLNDIDFIDGHDFEYLCADVLRKNGYSNVSVTNATGDFGIDVLAEKDGERYAIQCKRWNNKVTNKAVQEALSGKVYYGYDHAVVLTNNYFNEHAIETARRTGVILWDRDTLFSMIRSAYPDRVSFQTRQNTNWFSSPNNRYSSRKKPKLLGFVVAVILLLLFLLPKNNKQLSQKQNTDLDKAPNSTALDKSSTNKRPSTVSSYDGTWELIVADENYNTQYIAGWPRRKIDTKAGTITIYWANNPLAYEYEIISKGKLAFSYYWEEYTTSFYEEIEIKDGTIVSTLWYKGSDTPCNYFIYEAVE